MDVRALAAVELQDPDARPHRLGDYWASRPCVLVFLRHFG
jgi:hypothetical protein